MPQNRETELVDLETQVDGLVKQIDGLLHMGKVAAPGTDGPDSDDADQTGAGKHNIGDWKRKEKKHTHQTGSPVRGMVGKAAPEGEGDAEIEKRLEQAAELLGISKEEVELSMLALEKAKKFNFDNGNGNGADDGDDGDDGDDDASDPTKKAAPAEVESVVIEGETISKADVGEAVFNVLKKQSEKIDVQQKDIAKAKEDAEMERLRKRADDHYAHVPGSTEERAQMLKAVNALDPKLRKQFEAVFTQSEALAKSAFTSMGTAGGRGIEELRKTKVDFEKKVSEIAKRDGCSRIDALVKARHEDPEGFQAFQGN